MNQELRLKINPEYSRKKHKVFASAEIYLRELQEEEKWEVCTRLQVPTKQTAGYWLKIGL